MGTKNPRVAAYLPQEVYEKFLQFKLDKGLATSDDLKRNDSQALVQLLSEFLGVSHKVAYSNESDILSRLSDVEQKVTHLSSELDSLKGGLASEVTAEVLSELEGKIVEVVPGQLNLLDESEPVSELPVQPVAVLQTELLPLHGEALSRHFGLGKSAVKSAKERYGGSSERFKQWAKERDPQGVVWYYNEDTKKYHPIIE